MENSATAKAIATNILKSRKHVLATRRRQDDCRNRFIQGQHVEIDGMSFAIIKVEAKTLTLRAPAV